MLGVTSSLTSCGNSLLNAFKLSASALSATFTTTPVPFRYDVDRTRNLERRWGPNKMVNKMDLRGPLPRVASSKRIPQVPYVPNNNWAERRALFGQNDYIDILGDDESIHPIKFAYGVPHWLRGFRGSEYHMLLRKRWFFGAQIQSAYPRTALLMKKRLKFLYKRLNWKTKSYMDPRVMRR